MINEEKRVYLSGAEEKVRQYLQHYSPKKYWNRRDKVIHEYESAGFFKKIWLRYGLFYIKRTDAFNNASFGTHLGYGAEFEEVPGFPHGITGLSCPTTQKSGETVPYCIKLQSGEG